MWLMRHLLSCFSLVRVSVFKAFILSVNFSGKSKGQPNNKCRVKSTYEFIEMVGGSTP